MLRALKMSGGDVMVLFSSPLGNLLWAGFLLSIALPYILHWKRKRAAGETVFNEGEG